MGRNCWLEKVSLLREQSDGKASSVAKSYVWQNQYYG